MKRYRKKPIIIEAIQFTREEKNLAEIARLSNGIDITDDGEALRIETLEGIMRAAPGDWIIRGIKGELYPCKPDIFGATYEEVPD